MQSPIYLYVIKKDIKYWAKTCQNPDLKQIALAAVFYFQQVFIFKFLFLFSKTCFY